MNQRFHEEIDIASIVSKRSIEVYYQPIVSIVQNAVMGVEALSRGLDPITGELISPEKLFSAAGRAGLTIELDRLCREKALEGFTQTCHCHPNMMLFLNIDATILEKVVGSNHLLDATRKVGVNPENVIIEINELKINNTEALQQFIDTYRQYGYLIALDDVGSGFSNLDRILLTKPDIIKIDRGLIHGIDQSYLKQEVFKSVVSLCKKIGALVVAEGTETKEEVLVTLELGADLLQGFYFERPLKKSALTNICDCNIKTEDTVQRYKEYMVDIINADKKTKSYCETIMETVVAKLEKTPFDEFDQKLLEMIEEHKELECLYILNDAGVQVSESVCNLQKLVRKSVVFRPAKKGENHSLKNYYHYLVNRGVTTYFTSPYISLATGNLCITVSCFFTDQNGQKYVFCMDLSS